MTFIVTPDIPKNRRLRHSRGLLGYSYIHYVAADFSSPTPNVFRFDNHRHCVQCRRRITVLFSKR